MKTNHMHYEETDRLEYYIKYITQFINRCKRTNIELKVLEKNLNRIVENDDIFKENKKIIEIYIMYFTKKLTIKNICKKIKIEDYSTIKSFINCTKYNNYDCKTHLCCWCD